jgi:hypothetical protein
LTLDPLPPILPPVATDEGRPPDSAVQPSAIEAASERLEAFLKNRQLSQSATEGRREDLSSRDEDPPPPDDGDAVEQHLNETASDRRGRPTPLWIKAALAIAVVVAAAEGAYIAWRAAELPAAPPSQSGALPARSAEARRPAATPVERGNAETTDQRARGQLRSEGDAATNAAPTPATSASPSTATMGTIEVRTTPAGATVVFRGRRRGVTPLTIPDVAPGIHDVEVGGWFGSRIQRVTVRAGRTTALDLTVPPRR